MRFGNTTTWAIFGSALLFAACSSGSSSSGGAAGSISAIVQDLSADPTGQTTVITLPGVPGAPLTPANFEADGGQLASSVSVVGDEATVAWDDRVTPSHQVRAVGISGVSTDYASVSTSDVTAPTFTIAAGTQTPGLGGDTLELHFSGPRVVEAEAETLANWTIRQGGLNQDLTGSSFDYDPVTGIVDITLGTTANLHASYEILASGVHSVADTLVPAAAVNGVASGDSSVPSLVTAEQNLGADEFGRVVDFTFDEAMDPISGALLSNFTAPLPVFAVSVAQPSPEVLRVTFTEPMIPTVDSVTLANLEDPHGNDLVDAVVPVAQGSSVANGFASNPEVRTVENSSNDLVSVIFTQAIDPVDAIDWNHWDLEVDSTPIDLSGADFSYDLLTKSLTITLAMDFVNGTSFDLAPASGAEPIDVDGDLFTTTYSGTVSGDAVAPTVASATQNRTIAGDGTLVDVTFAEEVGQASAELTANWSSSGGQTVLSATRMADWKVVRVEFDDTVVPGDVSLSTSGVEDIAGNPMALTAGIGFLSSDTMAPLPTAPVAQAVEGADNDYLSVVFDDDMIEAEVEDPLQWAIAAPLGVPMDTSAATVDYDPVTREAVLTFVGGENFASRHGFSLLLTNMRDLGGNTVSPTTIFGTVTGDLSFPIAEVAWVDAVDPTLVHLRMSEPCSQFADSFDPSTNPLGLTTYELFDGLGTSLGYPSGVAVSADSMQVDLTFGATVVAGVHTLDLRGITDLASNQLFPVKDMPILTEDPVAPALQLGVSAALTVSGEDNDRVTVMFDRDMCPWGMEDESNYTLLLGASPVDLTRARLSFDGARTVVMDLDTVGADSLQTGGTYDLTVDGLCSAQGVLISGSTSDSMVASGDSSVPTLDAGRVRLDASDPSATILIEMSEALSPDDASDESLIDIGAVNPSLAVHVGQRTTRATFGGGASVGQTVNVSFHDLAGNLGLASQLVVGQDVVGPVVTAVEGVVVPGAGQDQLRVTFDKPVQTGVALNHNRYTLDQAGSFLDLSGSTPRYDSTTDTVVFILPEGVDLTEGVDVHVTASDILDLSGIAMTPADLSGTTAGDSVAPTLVSAYVNYRADFTGRTVDVLFSEDVDETNALLQNKWSSSGGQNQIGLIKLNESAYRLVFAAGFGSGDQMTVRDIEDLAGNAPGDLVVDITL